MLLLDVDAEREGFMEAVYNILSGDPDNVRANMIIDCYDNLPTIDAVPVVHGRWIDLGRNYYTVVSQCSECCAKYDFRSPYCPNCGAKMDGGAEDAAN